MLLINKLFLCFKKTYPYDILSPTFKLKSKIKVHLVLIQIQSLKIERWKQTLNLNFTKSSLSHQVFQCDNQHQQQL